jgi:Zn-dependent oligopeptidase
MFDHTTVTTDSIRALTDRTLRDAEAIVTEIVSATTPRTFASTVAPLEGIARLLSEAYGQGAFAGHVHPDADVRSAAREAEERLNKWALDMTYRDEVYAAMADFATTDEAAALTGEEHRFFEFWMRDLRIAGHELDPETRADVQSMRNRLLELELEFSRNLAENNDTITVSEADLAGMPPEYIEGLSPGAEPGTRLVTMDYPDVLPFMDLCPRRDLRERLSARFNSVEAEANGAILREAIELRARIARAFALPSWAHYRMQEKMAKTPDAVTEFYADLVPPLTTAGTQELAKIAERLHSDGHEGAPAGWDRRFYHTKALREDHGVDQLEVASYFPLRRVLAGLFDITEKVFGLSYAELDNDGAWHPDASLFEMRDAGSDETIAFFYMDLFPRDGKFTHAAAFPLVPAAHEPHGNRIVPVSAILANLTKPQSGRPSLLRHEEVVTLFHEFGHILHMSLSQARFTRFSAANTEWDFVEAPSQIMENWCWDPAVLATFAAHHETGEPIPRDLVERLAAARNLDGALFHLRQVFLGQIDLDIHASLDVPDPLEVEVNRSEITLFAHQPGTFSMASFGHLLGGYDAGYYGYLWAQVFGQDMFTAFRDGGVLSSTVGARYRRLVLEPNGTRDAIDLVTDFLGRDPSNEAFLEHLGIGH